MQDPADAELALELIDHTEELAEDLFPRRRWVEFSLLGLAILSFALADDPRRGVLLVAPIGLLALLELALKPFEKGRARQLEAARRANEALLADRGRHR